MCQDHHLPKYTSTDKHTDHDADHAKWNRRSFLKGMGLVGGASFLLGKTPINTFAASPLGMGLSNSNADRVLVMIKLKGGNDGLNTIIPIYDYSRYQNFRQGIAIPQGQALTLSNELGMHPAMSALSPYWQNGGMKIMNNVGYPDQNLSHFRSSDIWASASDENVTWDTGWLGRLFEDKYPDFLVSPPAIPPAVQIGGLGNLAFMGTDNVNYAVTVSSPEQLAYIAQVGGLYDANDVPECYYGEQLSYIRTVANNTFQYATVISNAYEQGSNQAVYSGSLGNQLAVVARLMKGGLGTKLYMVTLDGFDTHAGQLNQHANLLQSLAQNVTAFYSDLAFSGMDSKTLAFTYSEFGRRPQQNASQGTDHGAAAPMFLFGSALNGSGFMGGLPNLQDLDVNENLKYQLDFRSIYATLLDYWLCVEPNLVDLAIGQDFNRLNLGFNCETLSSYDSQYKTGLKHEVRYDAGQAHVYINLPSNGAVQISIFSAMGQLMGSVHQGFHFENEKLLIPIPQHFTRIPGYYLYKINFQGKVYSGKCLVSGR